MTGPKETLKYETVTLYNVIFWWIVRSRSNEYNISPSNTQHLQTIAQPCLVLLSSGWSNEPNISAKISWALWVPMQCSIKKWNKTMPCEDWAWQCHARLFNDPPNIFDRHQTRQSSTEQHRAAPSSSEKHRVAPSSIDQHRARLNKWLNEYNISPSRNVERCSVKCCIRLTGA